MPNPSVAGGSRDDAGSTVPAKDLERDAMIGRQVGSYKIRKLLGEGGMGAVYRATDTKLNRDVAIKIGVLLRPIPIGSPLSPAKRRCWSG